MFKNVASQKLIVFAFDSTTNLQKSGDAANITAYVSKDYGTVTVLGDTSATEMDATNAKGYYLFDLTQAETNGDTLLFSAKSSTSNIVVVGAPAAVFTYPASFTAFVTPTGAAVNATQFAGQTITAAAGVTLPTSVASPTNITAGTITTVTNLTNAPTAGDLTATMKTSVTTAATAATPTATIAVGTGTGQINLSGGLVPVKSQFQKNTAKAGYSFLMTDSTNHNPAPSLTVSVQRNIDNGGWNAGTNSVTEQTSGGANGTYKYDFSAADLNGDNIEFLFTATGADNLYFTVTTTPT